MPREPAPRFRTMLFGAWSALDDLQLCSFSSDAHHDLSYRERRRREEVVRSLGGHGRTASGGGWLVSRPYSPLPSFPPSLPPSPILLTLLIYSKTPRLVDWSIGRDRCWESNPGRCVHCIDEYCPPSSAGGSTGSFSLLVFPESPQVSWFHDEITGPWIVAAVMKLEDLMPSDPLLLLKSHSAHQHTIPRLARHLRTSDAYALPILKSFSRTFMPNNSPASSFYLIFHSGR